MSTIVVCIRKKELVQRGYVDFSHWASMPQNVYIGRSVGYVQGTFRSKWANPFSVKQYGREGCIMMYKEYIINTPYLWNSLEELEGKELGCWCKPEPCHGDILVELLEYKKRMYNSDVTVTIVEPPVYV